METVDAREKSVSLHSYVQEFMQGKKVVIPIAINRFLYLATLSKKNIRVFQAHSGLKESEQLYQGQDFSVGIVSDHYLSYTE